jgi:hypothetical protein
VANVSKVQFNQDANCRQHEARGMREEGN